MNYIKFGYNLLLAKLGNRPVPFQVTFNVTDTCNLRCKYCYLSYHSRKKSELSTAKWIEIINNLAKLGTVKINLSGGEPLLRKGIGDIITAVLENNIDCYVNTNGILVSKKIDVLRNISCLVVSLDGSERVNDSMRGKNSYKHVVNALTTACKNDIPVQVTMVLGTHNTDEIDYMLSFAKEYSARLNILTQIPVRSDNKFERVKVNEQYLLAVQRILDYKKAGEPITYSLKSWENFLQWPHNNINKDFVLRNQQIPDNFISCQAGKYFCVIDTDGDVYPCCSVIGNIPAPNILKIGLDKSLQEISNHPCVACNFPHNSEMNLLFGLDFNTIKNLLKIY